MVGVSLDQADLLDVEARKDRVILDQADAFLFLVVFIVALPEGIFHYIQRKYHQFERWVEV